MTDPLSRWKIYWQQQPFLMKLWSCIKNRIFPLNCVCCQAALPHQDDFAFCSLCRTFWGVIDPKNVCAVCYLPFAEESCLTLNLEKTTGYRSGEFICVRCQKTRPSYAFIRAPFCYGGSIASVLHVLKKGDREDLACWLGFFLVVDLESLLPNVDWVIPVPSHRKKMYIRGYNPVVSLLKAAQPHLLHSMPVLYNSIRRVTFDPQQGKNFDERRSLLQREDFSLVSHKLPKIKGMRILLIDDVITTGSTVEAISRLLLQGGAKQVSALALMRAF